MTTSHLPVVLCPVDFSEPSRAALGYAAAIADHFGARLVVVTVDDPLLAEAARTAGIASVADETERELWRFCDETLSHTPPGPKTLQVRVAVGEPAAEILRAAQDEAADLVVMGSHGRSGVRKLFFGSTTERLLRETTVPVLVTPDERPRTASLSEMCRNVNRVIAPVDLTAASTHQVAIAGAIAGAVGAPLIVAHVLEPVFTPLSIRLALPGADAARRAQAEEQLYAIARSVPAEVSVEPLILSGDPPEEIVRLAETRRANLVVMGLHSAGRLGPRMGSVTYRLLCLTRAMVLALPPQIAVDSRARLGRIGADESCRATLQTG